MLPILDEDLRWNIYQVHVNFNKCWNTTCTRQMKCNQKTTTNRNNKNQISVNLLNEAKVHQAGNLKLKATNIQNIQN